MIGRLPQDPPDKWYVFHIPQESSFKTSASDRSPICLNGKGELPTELSLYGRVETESTYIKSLAPDHLITVGYRGKNGTVNVTSRCKINTNHFTDKQLIFIFLDLLLGARKVPTALFSTLLPGRTWLNTSGQELTRRNIGFIDDTLNSESYIEQSSIGTEEQQGN
ncbi:hypothetical protein PSTT_00047 [Puccinia striiformis]|uniref:Uncharacterized protein n=1 Tax=Puccinia striiformis TaxID=27350 RepID=A0A2S4W885_9BASI|nr:hypothetical protein PSTT_00047 [Puccinia striiformis]